MNRKKIVALILTTIILSNSGIQVILAKASSNNAQKKPVIESVIDQSEIKATATSEQSIDPAINAIDGNLETMWHTKWDGSDELPQSLTLDLGKERVVSSIKLDSRLSEDNGKIKRYEIISKNEVIHSGTLRTDILTNVIRFENPIETDSIIIKVIEGVGGFASLAEVNVYETTGMAKKVSEYNNLRIENGANGNFNSDLNKINSLRQGTIIAKFDVKGDGIQTIFSASNNKKNNNHFHLYVQNGGIGYEIRNEGTNSFNIKGNIDASLNRGINTLAFKAEEGSGYSLYLNGKKVKFDKREDFKFIFDIEGINSIDVGKTDRLNGNEYNFTGDIDFIDIYDVALADDYLVKKTEETKTDKLPLPEGAYISDPVDVFKPNDLGSKAFRIPSLITTNKGTMIAGIDARINHGGDSPNNIDAAIKRSEDGGNTWIDGQKIIDYPGNASVIDSSLLQTDDGKIFLFITAFPEGYGFRASRQGTGFEEFQGENCMLLFDGEGTKGQAGQGNKYYIKPGGRVFDSNGSETAYMVDANNYLYEDGKAEAIGNTFLPTSKLKAYGTAYLALVESTDDGKTWSEPELISGQVKKEWMKFLGTGPGRGIQIKNGDKKGRIVFPVYYTNPNGFQSSAVIYSDDNGNTWDIGESPNDSRSDHSENSDTIRSGNELTECQVVEMPDGQLKLFMRNTGDYVRIATSFDGGETWHEDVAEDRNLREPYCQLSVINYSKTVDGKPAVIFANPDEVYPNRRNGTVRIGVINEIGTYENGEKKYEFDWKYNQSIISGHFAYSCLTEIQNGDVGLLYEGTGSAEMSYRKMSLDYIKTDLIESAKAAEIVSTETLDNDLSYLPGEEINIMINFNQTISLFGNRDIKILIGDREVQLNMKEYKDGKSVVYRGIIPSDISTGSKDIVIKSQEGLDIVTTTGKVTNLSNNINTNLSIKVGQEEAEKPEVNKDQLNDTISKAESLNKDDYTAESYKALKDAVDAAKIIDNKEDATQEEVDNATKSIEDAISKLEDKEETPDVDGVNRTELEKAINAAEKLNQKDYTKDSFKVFKDALKSANKVLKNEKATQEEIDAALKALNDSQSNLKVDNTKPEKPNKPGNGGNSGKPNNSTTLGISGGGSGNLPDTGMNTGAMSIFGIIASALGVTFLRK